MVEGDGFEEGHHAPGGRRHGEGAAEHAHGVVAAARAGEREPRDFAQGADGVVVVEVAAEPLLVGKAGDADDHRVLEGAVREELQRAGLSAQLVDGVVQVGQVLDLRHRQEARLGSPLGHAENRRLVQEGVEAARLPEAALEVLGQAVDSALLAHVLAKDERLRVREHRVVERLVDARCQGAARGRVLLLGELGAEHLAAILCGQRARALGPPELRLLGG